jgi:hypothetical protein
VPGLDTLASFDRAALQEVAVSLRVIRAIAPDVSRIWDYPPPTPAVTLILTSAAARRALAIGRRSLDRDSIERWRFPDRRGLMTTGTRSLDSLDQMFGAKALTMTVVDPISADPGAMVTVEFPPAVNVPRIVDAYQRSRDLIGALEGPTAMGPAGYRSVRIAADRGTRVWRFLFNEGRGDCPSGCLEYLRAIVWYDRDARRVTHVQRDTARNPLP